MVFKKHGKEIFGMAFTAKEEAALEAEINRRVEEKIPLVLRDMEAGIDAQLLWYLHIKLGWQKNGLTKAFYEFGDCIGELIDHYEMPEGEASWTAKEKLKDIGVDIDKLRAGETDEA